MDAHPYGGVAQGQGFDGGAQCVEDAFHKTLKKASLQIMVSTSAISFVFQRVCLLI